MKAAASRTKKSRVWMPSWITRRPSSLGTSRLSWCSGSPAWRISSANSSTRMRFMSSGSHMRPA